MNLEIFQSKEFGKIRTIKEGEVLLFCGADIALALGYAKPRNAVARHAKGALKRGILTEGGKQEMLFITEGDVYRLIINSKLPSAERFERWLFDEVVPTIRKYGGYMTDNLVDRIHENPAVIYEFADALLAERNRAEALEADLRLAKPKADYYDAFVNPNDCTNIRTTAKELAISERSFINFLLTQKYLFRSPSGILLPYAKPSNKGLFIVRDFQTRYIAGSQTFFTPKGKDLVRIKLREAMGQTPGTISTVR